MPKRIAAACAILAFAVCLVIGAFQADNPFATVVERALLAMAGTFAIGLLVGMMAQKMIDENIKAEEEMRKKSEANLPTSDR